MAKEWQDHWKTIRDIDEGGQGITKLVESLADGAIGVLKTPLERKLPRRYENVRRGKMRSEVVALESLDFPGVPRLLDDNTIEWRNFEVPLYFVMSHIAGETLQDRVRREVLSPIEAANLSRRLLDLLEQVHDRNVVHRDIKPNNIILCNDDPHDPWIVDFGQSFNASEEVGIPETPVWEQIGNRFLALPEYNQMGGFKRDPRSDVVLAAGIFLYSASQYEPRVLQDAEGRLPHQAKALPDGMAKFSRFFDRAFQVPIDRRFQSASEASKKITEIERMARDGDNAEVAMERLKARVESNEKINQNVSTRDVIDKALKSVEAAVNAFASTTGGHRFSTVGGGWNIQADQYTGSYRKGIALMGNDKIRCVPTWRATITGTEVIITCQTEERGRLEVFRFPVGSGIDQRALHHQVSATMATEVENWLDRLENSGVI